MKLYYTKDACSLTVRIILNELGLEFEDEPVDLRAKKTVKGDNYLEINPKGAVPALRLDNGEILTEIQAILQYLVDHTAGQKLLAPVGDYNRYKILEWMNYVSTELHKSLGMFFNPALTDEMKSKVLMPAITAKFTYIDDRLSKGSYLMGEEFTLPDAYLFVVLRWAHFFKMDFTPYKHINHFFDRINSRDAVIKSLKQENA